MKEEYGGFVFVAIVLVALASSTFIVLSEEKKTNDALKKLDRENYELRKAQEK